MDGHGGLYEKLWISRKLERTSERLASAKRRRVSDVIIEQAELLRTYGSCDEYDISFFLLDPMWDYRPIDILRRNKLY